MTRLYRLAILAVFLAMPAFALAADPWVVFQGEKGPGLGKNVVLISGDEEYRSEEALPQLAKILATRHGFTCTVLFALGSAGTIDEVLHERRWLRSTTDDEQGATLRGAGAGHKASESREGRNADE